MAMLALLAALIVRILWAGPALPRLEDEVAYHVQALIYESGALRGQLFTTSETLNFQLFPMVYDVRNLKF